VGSIIPNSITAGTTFKRTVTLTAFPAPDWQLSVVLRGPIAINLTAVADGAAHYFDIPATVTATWPPGAYWFSIRAAQGADLVEVEAGQVEVKPDLAGMSAGYDGRDHLRRVLEAIEAVIEKRATIDQDRYTINNRELWRTPIPELMALRDRYRSELRRAEALKSGRLFNQAVRVRFR
jgi:hypothetical protein